MIANTTNLTTVCTGQSSATVIADTIHNGKRITTFELVYPRYIHSEFMTHRMFSRNASSSRATPLSVTCSEVENDPVFFDYVGANQKGMVAGTQVSDEVLAEFKNEWAELGRYVASKVKSWSDKYGIHKQTLNRALEPWMRIRTLVTATEWENFFQLRLAADAQPEIRNLALAMQDSMDKSFANESLYHTPYWDSAFTESEFYTRVAPSCVARCARVSYLKHDLSEPKLSEDLALYQRLHHSGHCSPFEHVAVAKDGHYANFYGWQSLRNTMFG